MTPHDTLSDAPPPTPSRAGGLGFAGTAAVLLAVPAFSILAAAALLLAPMVTPGPAALKVAVGLIAWPAAAFPIALAAVFGAMAHAAIGERLARRRRL